MKILINGKLISPCNTKFEIVKDDNSTKAIIRGVVKEIIDIKLSRNEEKSSIQEFFDKYINSNNKSSKSLEYNGIVVKLSNNIKSYYGRVMKSLEIMKEGNEIKNFLDDNKVGGYLDKIHQIEEHLKSKPNDFVAKSDLSGEYINLGNEFSNLLDFEEAINSYEEAKKLSNEMLELHPDNNELKNDLALIFEKLGKSLQSMGRHEEAIEQFKQAKQIVNDLLKINPNNYTLQSDLASVLLNIGVAFYSLRKYEEALENYKKAKIIREELFNKNPENDSLKNDLVRVYVNYGQAINSLGKYEEAINIYEKAKIISEDILENNPDNDFLKNSLARVYMNLGTALKNIGKYKDTIENYEKVREIRENLLNKYSDNESFKKQLRYLYDQLSNLYKDIGDYKKAKEFKKLGINMNYTNDIQNYNDSEEPQFETFLENSLNSKSNKVSNINELYKKLDLIINNYDLYNILISLQTSHFLIFSGPSGTGKSTIIQKLAKHINGIDKNDKALGYLKVPIRSNYTDESSLLGYWNPLLSKYERTQTLGFLIDAYKNQTNPYFLLLDEMNLSRIENYFSDFLSKLDELKDKQESSEIFLFETIIDTTSKFKSIYNLLKSYDILGNNNFFSINKGDYEINDGVRTINVEYKDGGYEKFFIGNEEIQSKDGKLNEIIHFKFFIKLSHNLKVIGTINEDETTHSISNKVLDRAQFICFEVGDLFGKFSGESFNPPKDNINIMNYEYKEYSRIINDYIEIFEGKVSHFSSKQKEAISLIINDINNQIKLINSNESIGYRVTGDIGNYIKEFIDYENKKSFEGIEKALDYQIAQKVLTKIKSFSMINSQQITAFNNIGEILGYEKGKKIEEMKGYNSYPKTIKFYNYLYSNMIDE